jgi:hypothetical protein
MIFPSSMRNAVAIQCLRIAKLGGGQLNKKAHDAKNMLINMMRTYQTKTVKETGQKLVTIRNEIKQTLKTGKNPEGKVVTSSQTKELRKLLLHYREELEQLKLHTKIYKEEKGN